MEVSDEIKSLYKKTNDSTVVKDYAIKIGNEVLNNEKIVFGSFKLKEELCSSEQLTFGECNAAQLQFQCAAEIGDIKSMSIRISQFINGNEIKLGVFNVDSCILTANKKYRDIVAYDNIYLFRRDVSSWYNSLIFPITVNQMLISLCSHIGVAYENNLLINGNVTLDKTIEPDELMGSTVIECIAEINGGFFRADTDGKLEFVTIDSSASDSLQVKNYRTLKIEDFTTQKYTRLTIRSEEGDIGASAGSGDNAYIIEDNFLLYGKSTDELKPIAQRIYNAIKDISYTPYTAEHAGLPYIKPGNRIDYELVSGKIFTGLVLQRTLTGTQILKDSIKTTGTERTEAVYGIEKEILRLKGKANVLKRSIEETNLTITNVEDGLTNEIHQTASGLTAQIEQVSKEAGKEMPIYSVTEMPRLDNYPADTFYKDIYYPYDPEDERVLYPGSWTWEFDADTYKLHVGSIAYNEATGDCYKFVYEAREFSWRKLEGNELSYILSSIAGLKIETGQITLEVQETRKDIEDNYYTKVEADSKITQSAEKITQEVTELREAMDSDYYTKVEADSKIKQSATSIKQDVSATYATKETVTEVSGSLELKVDKSDNNRIVSMLNAAADEIYLKSNRFRLESTNTNIDTNGTIETKKINVTGGNISLDGSANTSSNISSSVTVVGKAGSSYAQLYSSALTSILQLEESESSCDLRANRLVFFGTNSQSELYGNKLSIFGKTGNTSALKFDITTTSGSSLDHQSQLSIDGSIKANGAIQNNGTGGSYTNGRFTVGGNGYNADYKLWVAGGAYVAGNLGCSGTKNRVVETRNYGKILLNAYETATPMFGDVGTGQLDENRECTIFLDDIFAETIDSRSEYIVFLQKYGQGDLWVAEITRYYFIVKGNVENLRFAWEVKAKQKDYSMYRLENETSNNFDAEYMNNDYISENDYETVEFENEETYENVEFEDVLDYEAIEFEDTETYEL